MDPEARQAIINKLRGVSMMMDFSVSEAVSKETKIPPVKVYQTIHSMKDAGEIADVGVSGGIRLSLQVFKSERPQKERLMEYVYENWIAIVGAVTGIIGAITGIAALIVSIITLLRNH